MLLHQSKALYPVVRVFVRAQLSSLQMWLCHCLGKGLVAIETMGNSWVCILGLGGLPCDLLDAESQSPSEVC